MKIVALDVGDVRIGVANSDDLGMIATPFEVIDRRKTKAVNRVFKIMEEFKTNFLVVGLPLSLDGTEKVQAQKVREFCRKLLESDESIRIEFVDERYTTVTADNILTRNGKKGAKNKRKVVDKIAASIILQNYLDRKKK